MTGSEYRTKVEEYARILIDAERMGERAEIILNSELAYDVARELRDIYEKPFDEEVLFEEILHDDDNGILGIAVNIYSDGEVKYFFQDVLSTLGETLEDDTDIVYIEKKYFDEIEKDKINCYEFVEL